MKLAFSTVPRERMTRDVTDGILTSFRHQVGVEAFQIVAVNGFPLPTRFSGTAEFSDEIVDSQYQPFPQGEEIAAILRENEVSTAVQLYRLEGNSNRNPRKTSRWGAFIYFRVPESSYFFLIECEQEYKERDSQTTPNGFEVSENYLHLSHPWNRFPVLYSLPGVLSYASPELKLAGANLDVPSRFGEGIINGLERFRWELSTNSLLSSRMMRYAFAAQLLPGAKELPMVGVWLERIFRAAR